MVDCKRNITTGWLGLKYWSFMISYITSVLKILSGLTFKTSQNAKKNLKSKWTIKSSHVYALLFPFMEYSLEISIELFFTLVFILILIFPLLKMNAVTNVLKVTPSQFCSFGAFALISTLSRNVFNFSNLTPNVSDKG